MRLDTAADIHGVPVCWFRDNARFSHKRFASCIEKGAVQEVEFIGMGTADAQTLYVGRRPKLSEFITSPASYGCNGESS